VLELAKEWVCAERRFSIGVPFERIPFLHIVDVCWTAELGRAKGVEAVGKTELVVFVFGNCVPRDITVKEICEDCFVRDVGATEFIDYLVNFVRLEIAVETVEEYTLVGLNSGPLW
jgi:hypothetical protein